VWSVVAVLVFLIQGSACWHRHPWCVQPPGSHHLSAPVLSLTSGLFSSLKLLAKVAFLLLGFYSLQQHLWCKQRFLKKMRVGEICAGVFRRFPKLGATAPKSGSKYYGLFPHLTTTDVQIHLSSLDLSP